MSTVASTRAAELHKLYNSVDHLAEESEWEAIVDGARPVTTPIAERLLAQMGLGRETEVPVRVLENACGTGIVAPILQQALKSDILRRSSILCGDFSDRMVGIVKKRIEKERWVNTRAEKVDGQNTGFADGAFTHVATNLGMHVMPDSEAALNETIRILEPGGILGFTTPHRVSGWMSDLKEAITSLPFDAPCDLTPLQTTTWGNWADVNWVRKTLTGKGLRNVQVDVFAYLVPMESAEKFVATFGMMIDWVMASDWPDELKQQHPREEVHALVKDYLEKKYEGNGWEMSNVVVVATGQVPC